MIQTVNVPDCKRTYMTTFWQYSSRNIHGRLTHPKVRYTHERCLNMWANGKLTLQEISAQTWLPENTVQSIVLRARHRGDPRAVPRRNHWRSRQAEGNRRKEQIVQLHGAGMEAAKIAKLLNISKRLVYLRIKQHA